MKHVSTATSEVGGNPDIVIDHLTSDSMTWEAEYTKSNRRLKTTVKVMVTLFSWLHVLSSCEK